MEKRELIKFPNTIMKEQGNGLTILIWGWYDMGTRAVLRGNISYGGDILDYICGVDKSQIVGDKNV